MIKQNAQATVNATMPTREQMLAFLAADKDLLKELTKTPEFASVVAEGSLATRASTLGVSSAGMVEWANPKKYSGVTFDIVVKGEAMRGTVRLQPSAKRLASDPKLSDICKDAMVIAAAKVLEITKL